ncbi:MAG: sensor domain-containing diguanylate cyclase [Sulfurospirillaceae bacterium]|nr:sensor domain-containing diguanylate cyclase [Sulfurospirillaceae bacterium]MDD3462796.1 sensor domain-containing diguanylate cyclase [Sulfurospirillaceae bacterium]
MTTSSVFLKSILDSIVEQIAVIDLAGNIVFVNQSWISFGQNNQCKSKADWTTINYLKVCDDSAKMGDHFGQKASVGIRKVIASEIPMFYFEYPCHSPKEKRWFIMSVTPFLFENNTYLVISHKNITQRKIAEEAVLNLSRIDGLTNIPNRRYFDNFLKEEWRRCLRLQLPITLAIIDIDYFKLINDTYGHQAGDECLKKIGLLVKKFTKRPSDLCARYGGEEFAIIFGNTDFKTSMKMLNRLLKDITDLQIPNEKSPIMPTLTVSIGVSTILPSAQISEKTLVASADKLLYIAKEKGRNQILGQIL